MKISFLPIKNNTVTTHGQTKKNEMKTLKTENHSNPFVGHNGLYGRAIAFNSRTITVSELEKVKTTLTNFLNTDVRSFLMKTKKTYVQNTELHNSTEKMMDMYSKRQRAHWHDISKDLNLEELDFLDKNISRPLLYQKNIQEYNYLKEKSRKDFSSEEAYTYADKIREIVLESNPYLESFNPLIRRLNRTNIDIKNGFVNLTKSKNSAVLAKRRENIHEASSLSLFNGTFVRDVRIFKDNVRKALGLKLNDQITQRLLNYENKINEIQGTIAEHKELQPQIEVRFKKAQKLVRENSFNQDDVDKMFDSIESKRQGIINRNVKKLKAYFDRNPEYIWDNTKNAEIDALLERQNEANGKLWQLIEDSKKEYYRPRTDMEIAEADIKAKHAIAVEMEARGITNFDDLPF